MDSFGQPSGASLVAAGKHFNVRYVTGAGKALTSDQVHDLFNHGISVVANFESTKTRALDGWAAGVEDASDAKVAMDALGFPPDCPCYFSVDFDAQIVQQGRIDQYLKGAASVIGAQRVGVYGSYAVVTRCHGNQTAAWLWQTYAYSSGHLSPFANLYQWLNDQKIGGRLVDFDRAMTAQYGAWDPPGGAGPEEPVSDVIYSIGGTKTAVFSGPYSHEPGGAVVGAIATPTRFLIGGYDVTGRYVAINGLYAATTQLPKPVAMGWVLAGSASAVEDFNTTDCTTEVAAAIALDRSKARIVYG